MLEQHPLEQYFWDEATINQVADAAARFPNPCCLCAPMVGRELEKRGLETRVLDVDERFFDVAGFRRFDLYRPEWLGETFGVIVCDPPFWIVSLSQLFAAIRLLARHDYAQPLAICYPTRRGANLTGTFARFGLAPTGFLPKYIS
ncbi:MAG: protein-lysine N-methyltransferase, partial [Armatimonadetes bacterium]|nr:protein-lysine N-methyltransferase [Armatimonadota bacterium]